MTTGYRLQATGYSQIGYGYLPANLAVACSLLAVAPVTPSLQ